MIVLQVTMSLRVMIHTKQFLTARITKMRDNLSWMTDKLDVGLGERSINLEYLDFAENPYPSLYIHSLKMFI